MKSINYDYPIFVYYLDTRSLAPYHVTDKIEKLKDEFNYSNLNFMFVPTDAPSKIECVYDGKNYNTHIENLKEIIKDLSISKDMTDFKVKLRNWNIDRILD